MDCHTLKTWPPHFGQVKYGDCRVEIRKNDRGFKDGDILILMEWIPDENDKSKGHYTHDTCPVRVHHIKENLPPGFGLEEGFCAMTIGLYSGPLPDVME